VNLNETAALLNGVADPVASPIAARSRSREPAKQVLGFTKQAVELLVRRDVGRYGDHAGVSIIFQTQVPG
jgi:hypothetical protein